MKSEVPAYLIMMAIAITIVTLVFQLKLFDSVFHVISAMTNCGFMYLDVQGFPVNLKFFLSILMFIGGTSLSTAGGIKIYRFLLMFKVIRTSVRESVTQKGENITLFGREYTKQDIVQCLVTIGIMAITVLLASLAISSYGFSLSDSIFEITSAIANTGLTVNVATVHLAVEAKWLFIAVMLVGRVEVFSFLIMFSRAKEVHY